MPSGRGGSGGHFGGGFSGSHSGGHFGGSSSFRSHSTRTPSHVHLHPFFFPHPHVTFFMGRQVYLGSGRASSLSILRIFLVLGVIVAAFLGISWMACSDDLSEIEEDYAFYQTLAEYAETHPDYQIEAVVDRIEQYDQTGKYCIFYSFGSNNQYNGYSFYVYTREQAHALEQNGVILALEDSKDYLNYTTDSVPLDYLGTKLTDDAEYLEYRNTCNGFRTATLVVGAIDAVLILLLIMIPLTAAKPTEEQLKNSNQNDSTKQDAGTVDNRSASSAGAWHCEYCGSLNDSGKRTCDSCGAKRQN